MSRYFLVSLQSIPALLRYRNIPVRENCIVREKTDARSKTCVRASVFLFEWLDRLRGLNFKFSVIEQGSDQNNEAGTAVMYQSAGRWCQDTQNRQDDSDKVDGHGQRNTEFDGVDRSIGQTLQIAPTPAPSTRPIPCTASCRWSSARSTATAFP